MDKNTDLTPEQGTDEEKLEPQQKEEQGLEIETNPEETPEEETPEPEAEPEATPEIDYKKKFSESTRENQILQARLKEKESQLGFITNDEPPTEAELKAKFTDWDDKMDEEKEILRHQLALEKKVNKATLELSKMQAEREWNNKINHFLDKAQLLDDYSGLKGKEEEFRAFANKPTHKGTSLDVLAKAFLYQPGNEVPKPKHTKPVLEKGSGGTKNTTKHTLTPEEIMMIRKNDSKRYNQLVKEGKIKIEI